MIKINSYERRESGKPPKYNVLLNELPNGNNPLKIKTKIFFFKKIFSIYLMKYFHHLILHVFHYVKYVLVNENMYQVQLYLVIELLK